MMADVVLENIKSLAGILEDGRVKKSGSEMSELKLIPDAWLRISNGRIAAYGEMQNIPQDAEFKQIKRQDCTGRFVLPSFVDSHTHIVFAASREEEFVLRIKGKTYEEIAAAGGGILNSASRLQKMTEDELFERAFERLMQVVYTGTGAIEIKSGYGLTVEDEIKMLRVIKRIKAVSPIPVVSTFLGAHAFPAAYKQNHSGYIQLIIDEMLPRIADEKLADYIDVFCDQGFFNPEETGQLLEAGAKYGLRAKIHGNELGYTGGVQTAVKYNALSVDHLEYTGNDEIECLKSGNTMPVALPGCSFFLGIPYAPVRKMIDAGLPVCLASDFNPGSTPNGRMGFVVSLACTQMKLTPEEAINATTINGAYALGLSEELGSVTVGKRANLIITKPINSLAIIPYYFGVDQVESVVLNGAVIQAAGR